MAADVARTWRRAWGTALDFVYPPSCPACLAPKRTGSPFSLCRDCTATTRPLGPPFCARCGEPFPSGVPLGFECSNCVGRPFAFEFAIASHENAGAVRDMVHRFKYHSEFALRVPLARLAQPAFADPRVRAGFAGAILVPVPLHPKRRRERGFNQSEELARVLARLLGHRWANVLRRRVYTTAQAQLDRSQRLANLRGAFALRPAAARWHRLEGQCALLIDDVFTTGATAQECARVLTAEAGVQKVAVVTVARG